MLPTSATSGCGRVARPHEMAGLPRFLLCRTECGLPIPYFLPMREKDPEIEVKKEGGVGDGPFAALPSSLYRVRYNIYISRKLGR